MSFSIEQQANETLTQVKENFTQHFSALESQQLGIFCDIFFHAVAAEEIVTWGEKTDIYACLLHHWQSLQQYQKEHVFLKVFNPHFEQQGWQSKHSIINVLIKDMPFLVDSLQMLLNRLGLTFHRIIHPVFLTQRDSNGQLIALYTLENPPNKTETLRQECLLHIEIDRHSEIAALTVLQQHIANTLQQVRFAVEDWQAMRQLLTQSIESLQSIANLQTEHLEQIEFLQWLLNNHFIFLGVCDYQFDEQQSLQLKQESCLGIAKNPTIFPQQAVLTDALQNWFTEQTKFLLLSKSYQQSIIHRPAYMDYIAIKCFDKTGTMIGERRFLGLYTSLAYRETIRTIPLIRQKVNNVFQAAGYPPHSHAGKTLINILESYPRDELLQMDESSLLKNAVGIVQVQERQRLRLFIRADLYGNFFTCLVFAPRERYNSEVRKAMQLLLKQSLQAENVEFYVTLSESILAQVYFIVHLAEGKTASLENFDVAYLEQQLAHLIQRWQDVLRSYLIAHYGEEQGTRWFNAYEMAFPIAYQADFNARQAVYDIERLESLNAECELTLSLSRPLENPNVLYLKLFTQTLIPLSKILPMLENLGVCVFNERSYTIQATHKSTLWIQEFSLQLDNVALSALKERELSALQNDFQALFIRMWRAEVENDSFNRLVLLAAMHWREVVIFRAYCKYLKQTGINFSQAYMEQAIIRNPNIARILLNLFYLRFQPDSLFDEENRQANFKQLQTQLRAALEQVSSLDEDRILQRFAALIQATLRTNYFQINAKGEEKAYLSFKFDSHQIPELPEPRPLFEIFVYSPRVEAVHLRGGKVARGGLRWSDRLEDFRTEILGLVKAQQVKNALIVPVGSKGGFVVKRAVEPSERQAEGIACYETLIRGLLDLTDNLSPTGIIPPAAVVRYDADDPYLVVAADKGTASFSDIANKIALEYGFWLGDAFASGGSAGYDHKKMGITARGAWEATKRHLRSLQIDSQTQCFTAVGIGDMSGDVFGNGMLLSETIQLIAAFDHRHIFIDPQPDPARSFAERQRLFALPRSSWADYDAQILSAGGGVYARTQKAIQLSAPAAQCLGLTAQRAYAPNEIIKAILTAPVDLLWNGGIGTYVKASSEHHLDVGDRTNDGVRVNGQDLRCKVVVEGGNLGFTQLGRIEFALTGGKIHTDAMDNSGGVNCSDNEVNIKILLNALVAEGELTHKHRNQVLAEMTHDVAKLVIHNNYLQMQAIALAHHHALHWLDVHSRFIRDLEKRGKLARELEKLPSDKQLAERRAMQQGLTLPELCVLLAYSKIDLYEALLHSSLPDMEDALLHQILVEYFPPLLSQRFATHLAQHRLRREIIATELTNRVINYGGSLFVFLLKEETGATEAEICTAFMMAWEIFDLGQAWQAIEQLPASVSSELTTELMLLLRKVMDRASRWLLRHYRAPLTMSTTIASFKAGQQQLVEHWLHYLPTNEQETLLNQTVHWEQQGIPAPLAQHLSRLESSLAILDIVTVANTTQLALTEIAPLYFELNHLLKLQWLRHQISALPRDNQWTALARAALRDELNRTHRELTLSVLNLETQQTAAEQWQTWQQQKQALLSRCLTVLNELASIEKPIFAMLSVAVREIRNLL